MSTLLAAEEFIRTKARPLDRDLYFFLAGKASKESVLLELKEYQNNDGGFGHGIEPDITSNCSSVIGTSVALQYLNRIEVDLDEAVLQSTISYLISQFDTKVPGWHLITESNNDFAHAPWWEISRVKKSFAWGNPSAEITGYFIKYSKLVDDKDMIDSLKMNSIKRIEQINDPEFHELLCFTRLFDLGDSASKKDMYNQLCALIQDVVVLDTKKWGPYVPTALTFVSGPHSSFIGLFDEEIVQKNLKFLLETIKADHWEPNWDWGGSFPDDWAKAKTEWSGKLTVENILKLKNFRAL